MFLANAYRPKLVDGTNEKKTVTTFGGAPVRSVFATVSNRVTAKVFPVVEHPSSADQSLGYIPCPSPAGGFVGEGKKTVTFVRETLPSVRGRYSRDTRQTCGGVHNRSAIRVTRETVCIRVYTQSKRPGRIPRRRRIVRFVSARHRQNGNTSQWRAVFVMEKSPGLGAKYGKVHGNDATEPPPPRPRSDAAPTRGLVNAI